MAKPSLKVVPPITVNRTVGPLRRPNAETRTREYLTAAEVEALMEATKSNRQGHRDATMILVAYRHGLRAAEVVDMRWEQVDFFAATLAVRRVKKGTPATHPIRGDEIRALRRLQRESPQSPFLFVSERGACPVWGTPPPLIRRLMPAKATPSLRRKPNRYLKGFLRVYARRAHTSRPSPSRPSP